MNNAVQPPEGGEARTEKRLLDYCWLGGGAVSWPSNAAWCIIIIIIIILRSLPYIYLSLPYLTHDHFSQSSSDVRRIEQTWTSFAYKSRRHEYLNFYWLPKYYGELFLMESRFVSPETGDEVYDASLPIFYFYFYFYFFFKDLVNISNNNNNNNNIFGPNKSQTERSDLYSEPVQIDCF